MRQIDPAATVGSAAAVTSPWGGVDAMRGVSLQAALLIELNGQRAAREARLGKVATGAGRETERPSA